MSLLMFFKQNELLRFNDVRLISSGYFLRLPFSDETRFFTSMFFFISVKNKIPSPLCTSSIRILILYANVTRSKRTKGASFQTICHRVRPFGMYIHTRYLTASTVIVIHCSCTLNTRQHPVNRRLRLGRHNFSGNPTRIPVVIQQIGQEER